DIDIMNCALHIKHLEHAFYTEGLSCFSKQDFEGAGLGPWTRGRIQQIEEHEKNHVAFLTDTVIDAGGNPTKPCTYKFPYKDPMSFVRLASMFETIGTSAYHGTSVMLHDKKYVAASGAIFAVEAQHSGWIDASVLKGSGWSGSFNVPLNWGHVLSLISPYVESCPSKNPPLPASYPHLAISNAHPGQTASLEFAPEPEYLSSSDTTLYATFMTSNVGMLCVPVDLKRKTVNVPADIRGDCFVVITNETQVTDET
ncbi:ferritin-like domain-containing protein, partial [Rhodocollybia butyracea]